MKRLSIQVFQGIQGIQVKVTAIHSKVSLISVLAPSPDWFVGVDSHDLCENGRWREAWHVITLLPYDSGTDSGSQFIGRDQETVQPVPIFRVNYTMDGVFPWELNRRRINICDLFFYLLIRAGQLWKVLLDSVTIVPLENVASFTALQSSPMLVTALK